MSGIEQYVTTLIAIHLFAAVLVIYTLKKNPKRNDDEWICSLSFNWAELQRWSGLLRNKISQVKKFLTWENSCVILSAEVKNENYYSC